MRNLLYIVACLLVSIIVGLFSPLISPELFNLVRLKDVNEQEYTEIVEIKVEEPLLAEDKPIADEDSEIGEKVVVTDAEFVADDDYVEELPPEILFRINRYGKSEFWNYYRDASRINFSKKMRNLYEEVYGVKINKEAKFKYSIHVFASKNITRISRLKLSGLCENYDKDEELYRYFYRSYDNYWVCRRELRDVRSKGFPDAYIVKL